MSVGQLKNDISNIGFSDNPQIKQLGHLYSISTYNKHKDRALFTHWPKNRAYDPTHTTVGTTWLTQVPSASDTVPAGSAHRQHAELIPTLRAQMAATTTEHQPRVEAG
jgi:hypothetical protein